MKVKKVFWTTIAILVGSFLITTLENPDLLVYPVSCNDKCQTTNSTAPYYDLWGNEFSYQGKLIKASSEQKDPVSGKPNPYFKASKPVPARKAAVLKSKPISSCESSK